MNKNVCPNCGHEIIKYPLFKTVGGKKIFIKDNWPNLFKMDFVSFFILILVLFLAWSYQHDTEAYKYTYENIYEVCEKYTCVKEPDTYPNFNQETVQGLLDNYQNEGNPP